MNHLCFQKAFEAIMLAEVFIFIQHVIGFHISIGKTGLFSSSRYRACLDRTLGYSPAWELPVFICKNAWPGKAKTCCVVWLMPWKRAWAGREARHRLVVQLAWVTLIIVYECQDYFHMKHFIDKVIVDIWRISHHENK